MQKDEANAGRPTSNLKGEYQSYPNLGAIQFGRLLAFCDSRNKSWRAIRLMIKSVSFYVCLYCSTAPAIRSVTRTWARFSSEGYWRFAIREISLGGRSGL